MFAKGGRSNLMAHAYIYDFFIDNALPMSVYESESWRAMMRFLQPNLELFSRTYATERVHHLRTARDSQLATTLKGTFPFTLVSHSLTVSLLYHCL